MALVNGRIVLPDRVVTSQALVIEGGRIVGSGRPDAIWARDQASRRWADSWSRPASSTSTPTARCGTPSTSRIPRPGPSSPRENLRRGTTSLLATFAPTPNLEEGLAFCRQWMASKHGGARVLGAYLESPYVNVAQKGALDASCVRAADDGTAASLLQLRRHPARLHAGAGAAGRVGPGRGVERGRYRARGGPHHGARHARAPLRCRSGCAT